MCRPPSFITEMHLPALLACGSQVNVGNKICPLFRFCLGFIAQVTIQSMRVSPHLVKNKELCCISLAIEILYHLSSERGTKVETSTAK